jgi:hypothetical protein
VDDADFFFFFFFFFFSSYGLVNLNNDGAHGKHNVTKLQNKN